MSDDAKRDLNRLWDDILDSRYGPYPGHFLSATEYRMASSELQRMAVEARMV